MMKAKAQSSTGVATFLALLGLIIIFYILFLPPADRERLLSGKEPAPSGGGEVAPTDIPAMPKEVIIITEKPGILDYQGSTEFEHSLPAFTLFKTTNAYELLRENAFYVKNGWFDKKSKEVAFSIENLENTNNVMLSFGVKKSRGPLSIFLNNKLIFEGIVTGETRPIILNKGSLAKDNVLYFEVGSVDWKFWTTNEYYIESMLITGDITDLSRQASQNVFFLSDEEGRNLKRAVLKFNPNCRPAETGILTVMVNNRNLFNGIPDCGVLNSIEMSPGLISSGSNNLIFATSEGSYLIDQIKVVTELEEVIYPTYYFELVPEDFDAVVNGFLRLILSLEFLNDGEQKRLEVYVNGHKTFAETKGGLWEKDISLFTRPGSNYIKLMPKVDTEIVTLQVALASTQV